MLQSPETKERRKEQFAPQEPDPAKKTGISLSAQVSPPKASLVSACRTDTLRDQVLACITRAKISPEAKHPEQRGTQTEKGGKKEKMLSVDDNIFAAVH